MVTKKLHSQQRGNFCASIVWMAFLAFFGYLMVQIYLHGIGESSGNSRFGLKGLFSSYLRKLEAEGQEDLAKWILLLICAVAGIYVFIRTIISLFHIAPKYTELGQSIYRQMSENGNFKELCEQMDHDMERGYQEFGVGVFVSSSWILEEEIMQLHSIQTIYDYVSSGEKTLILEDMDGYCMKIEFIMQEWAEELLEYFKKSLPMVKMVKGNGDQEEEIELGKMFSWHIEKTKEEVEEYKELASQGDAYAQTEFGKCLLFGKAGITPDGIAAYEWFQKAAAQSNEIAKMYLGHCKLYGIGTNKDENEGYKMLDSALNYNYPEDSSSQPLAEYSTFENEDLVQLFWDLGNALEKSLGVVQNYRVAVYYFTMIDDWGHPEGAKRMRHYKKGLSGWKKID